MMRRNGVMRRFVTVKRDEQGASKDAPSAARGRMFPLLSRSFLFSFPTGVYTHVRSAHAKAVGLKLLGSAGKRAKYVPALVFGLVAGTKVRGPSS